MGLIPLLVLAAAPAINAPVEAKPVVPVQRPAETAVSVGLGRVRQGGALGLGLSLARGAAADAPAPGKTRLVYRLEVHTTESGFPRWVEGRLSITEGRKAGSAGTALATPDRSDGAFLAAVACVLRWLQPRDQHVFTFVGTTGQPAPMQRPDAGTPAALTLGWGVEF